MSDFYNWESRALSESKQFYEYRIPLGVYEDTK